MRLFNILILVLVSLGFASAQSEMGTIVVIRPKVSSGPRHMVSVLAKSEVIGTLKNGSYCSKALPTGKYNISSNKSNSENLDIEIEPNDTIYVRCRVTYSQTNLKVDFYKIDSEWAKVAIASLNKENDNNLVDEEDNRNHFSAGFLCGSAVGFFPIEAFETSDGAKLLLSPGGGVSLGAVFNYQFSADYSIYADIRYHFSTLTPSHKDVSASFQKSTINLIGLGLLPFKSKVLKSKIGAGACMHFGSNMELDGSKVNLGYATVHYNRAYGFLFGGQVETKYKNCLFFISMFFNVISYKHERANFNGQFALIIDKRLSEPNASGFDITIGVRFNP